MWSSILAKDWTDFSAETKVSAWAEDPQLASGLVRFVWKNTTISYITKWIILLSGVNDNVENQNDDVGGHGRPVVH